VFRVEVGLVSVL